MFTTTSLWTLVAISLVILGCNQVQQSDGISKRQHRSAVLKGAAFGQPEGSSKGGKGEPEDETTTDTTPTRPKGGDHDIPPNDTDSSDDGTPEGTDGGGKIPGDDIVTRPPIFDICWTKAEENNKETVVSSPGISYKIYNTKGQVVFNGNTSPAAAAAAKADHEATRSMTIRMPRVDGSYTLAFCDASKHASCHLPNNVMGSLGGKQKSWGFRSLKNAPGVIGAIPNMKVSGGNLYAADQPFIIYNSVEDPFCMAAWSPLVIDLKGEGVVLSSPAKGVMFDMDGDGKKDRVSWPTKPSSVFVTLDRNGNGAIDSVHELFGNNTVGPDGEKAENGFTALAKYDVNRDGRIDAKDSIFKSLKLWGDKNRDGVSQAKELVSLSKAGVLAIDLDYVDIFEIDAYGNQTLQRSTVEVSDKKAGTVFKLIFDIWFKI